MFNDIDSVIKNRYPVFSHKTYKIQPAASKRLVITGLLIVAGSLNFCSVGFAQTQLESSGLHSGRLHSGRITKSFTEPVEQSVAASAEPGIVAESSVKEGDIVKWALRWPRLIEPYCLSLWRSPKHAPNQQLDWTPRDHNWKCSRHRSRQCSLWSLADLSLIHISEPTRPY